MDEMLFAWRENAIELLEVPSTWISRRYDQASLMPFGPQVKPMLPNTYCIIYAI